MWYFENAVSVLALLVIERLVLYNVLKEVVFSGLI